MAARTRSVCASHRSRNALRTGVPACLVASLLVGCSTSGSPAGSGPEDGVPVVVAAAETDPVRRFGDAADDPVILVTADRRQTWIAGTDKKFGLRIYDLDGTELHALGTGRVNNVDAVPTGTDTFLLAASNRTTNSIDLYSAALSNNDVRLVGAVPLEFEEPYGLCMSAADPGVEVSGFQVFVGDKTGRVQQWSVTSDYQGALIAEFRFDSQTEGCVFDAASGTLFVGEEERGIWAIELATGNRKLVDSTGADRLTADVEGLDIYDDGLRRLLIASSQGDNSFVIYDLATLEPLLRFRIAPDADNRLDGVSETDGIAVTSVALPGFERGILVVQDGHNTLPRRRQNFKIVDWREIDGLLQKLP